MNPKKLDNRYFDSKIIELGTERKDFIAKTMILRSKELIKQMEPLEKEYNSAKAIFDKAKAKFEEAQSYFEPIRSKYEILESEYNMCEDVISLHTSGADKPKDVQTKVKAPVKKAKIPKLSRVDWVTEIHNMIAHLNHPLHFGEIWDRLAKDVSFQHKLIERGMNFNKQKVPQKFNIESHCNMVRTRKRGKQLIIRLEDGRYDVPRG